MEGYIEVLIEDREEVPESTPQATDLRLRGSTGSKSGVIISLCQRKLYSLAGPP